MSGSRLSRGKERLSLAQLFAIGIGPSSSATVRAMRAKRSFLEQVLDRFAQLICLECDRCGSLALAGVRHGTDGAVLLGLPGEAPGSIDVDYVPEVVKRCTPGDARQWQTTDLMERDHRDDAAGRGMT